MHMNVLKAGFSCKNYQLKNNPTSLPLLCLRSSLSNRTTAVLSRA